MPNPIKTVTADATTPLLVDGRNYGHAPIKATPWVTEIGSPEVGDGVVAVDCDRVIHAKHIRGWAVRLQLREQPAFDKLQAPVVAAKAVCCYGGILVEAADVNLHQPRVCSFRDVGVWLKAGNCHANGGHIYGGTTAIKIGGDPQYSGRCSLNGTQFSDAKIGCEILVPSQLTGCFSQHCWERGILVGSRAEIINTEIGCFAGNLGDSTGYVGIELAYRDGLCANWSTYQGAIIVGKNATGIIANADNCEIDATVSGCGENATALRIQRAINGCWMHIRAVQCGGGVVIQDLGSDNRIDLDRPGNLVLPPAGWSKRNNVIRRNGVAVEDK